MNTTKIESIARFMERLATEPTWLERIGTDTEESFQQWAGAEGFDFSLAELEEAVTRLQLRQEAEDGAIGDDDLAAVSGGGVSLSFGILGDKLLQLLSGRGAASLGKPDIVSLAGPGPVKLPTSEL